MNILVIHGSPRKGAGFRTVQQIETKMRLLGDVQFEHVFLKDAGLEPCRGCFACVPKGEERCPIRDARPALEARMLAADGVIFVSPSYSQSVSAMMKNFIDRFSYTSHRPRYFKQFALVVATTYGMGDTETVSYMAKVFRAWGFAIVDRLCIKTWPMANAAKTEQQIEKAAQKFYRAIELKKRPAPGLIDVLQFRFMRENAKMSKEMFSGDHAYYQSQGWMDSDYYTGRINPFTNLAARFLVWAIGKMMVG